MSDFGFWAFLAIMIILFTGDPHLLSVIIENLQQ